MNAEQFGRRQHAHLLRDECTPIAALRDVARVAEALHQHSPGARDAGAIPTGGRRLARKTIARYRRDHDMEGIRRATAMGGGIGERIDDLQLLDDRAGPAVRDDERQRVGVLRTDVDEMNIQPVDLGDEVRQRAQSRLARTPVVFRSPIARELLNRRELHALRCICDRFPLGPLRRLDAPEHVGEFCFRKTDMKRTNCGGVVHLLCYCIHGIAPSVKRWGIPVCAPERATRCQQSRCSSLLRDYLVSVDTLVSVSARASRSRRQSMNLRSAG